MCHDFNVGDRVSNGAAVATVVGLVADDALLVVYDGDTETTVELATYFRRIDWGIAI